MAQGQSLETNGIIYGMTDKEYTFRLMEEGELEEAEGSEEKKTPEGEEEKTEGEKEEEKTESN